MLCLNQFLRPSNSPCDVMFPSDQHHHDDDMSAGPSQDGWLYTILFPCRLPLVAAMAAGPFIYLTFRTSVGGFIVFQ